jgi:hypothetical protein
MGSIIKTIYDQAYLHINAFQAHQIDLVSNQSEVLSYAKLELAQVESICSARDASL